MQTKTIATAIIIIGIVMVAYSGFNYVTTEKVVDIGPITINQEKNHNVQWPPIFGVLLLVGGVLMFVLNKNVRNKYNYIPSILLWYKIQ